MDDIANELGISKKTIYQHFSSKNELVKETVDFVFDTAINRLKDIQGKSETPIHEHFAMKSCVADLFGFNIQASTIYQFNKYYPRLAERIQKKRHANYDLTILKNLKEGVEKGYYRKEIDIDFVGKIFFSSSTAFFNDEIFINGQNSESLDELNYNFLEEVLNQKIESLSGGEKNLLQFAKISVSNANLLLLDEPTSHLDTYSQIALENALKDYNGAILMISHDFYSIVNCMDYALIIDDKTIRKMSMRKFRKMIYARHFDKDYLELEQKKKELETKVELALKDMDFTLAKTLCVELEGLIKLL